MFGDVATIRGRWYRSGIPARHGLELLGNDELLRADLAFGPGPAMEAAQSLLTAIEQRETVVVLGKVGRGKTRMLAWAAMQWLSQVAQDRKARYTTAVDMIDDLQEKMHAGQFRTGRVAYEWHPHTESPGLLLIDEVQDIRTTEDALRQMKAVVDQRYRERAATVLAGNCTRDELGTLLGTNIARRVTDAGRVIECDWPRWEGGAA